MPAGTHRRLSRSVSLSRCFKAVGYAETFFCSHSCFSGLVDVSGLIVALCVLTFSLSLYRRGHRSALISLTFEIKSQTVNLFLLHWKNEFLWLWLWIDDVTGQLFCCSVSSALFQTLVSCLHRQHPSKGTWSLINHIVLIVKHWIQSICMSSIEQPGGDFADWLFSLEGGTYFSRAAIFGRSSFSHSM